MKKEIKCVIIATAATVLAMTLTSCTETTDSPYQESIECLKVQAEISERYEKALELAESEDQKAILYEQYRVDLLNACQ